MERLLRPVIGENIELATRLSPDAGRTRADAGQLEQVIMNLVVNAKDAMPEGGKITLQSSNVTVRQDFHEQRFILPGPYVVISVSDTGHGMDKETQSRIFEPFFTTKEKGKGTGLGLSTVYGIVKQSNGYVYPQSETGSGTTFYIYLPRVEDSAEGVSPAKSYGLRKTAKCTSTSSSPTLSCPAWADGNWRRNFCWPAPASACSTSPGIPRTRLCIRVV
jgi:signal transduction histidine kinase